MSGFSGRRPGTGLQRFHCEARGGKVGNFLDEVAGPVSPLQPNGIQFAVGGASFFPVELQLIDMDV